LRINFGLNFQKGMGRFIESPFLIFISQYFSICKLISTIKEKPNVIFNLIVKAKSVKLNDKFLHEIEEA